MVTSVPCIRLLHWVSCTRDTPTTQRSAPMALAVMCPLSIQPLGRCARLLRYAINGVQAKVTVAQDDDSADLALRQLYNAPCRRGIADGSLLNDADDPIVTSDRLVLSVDTEWTPVPHEAPPDQKPDVIQVCDGSRVVIIQCALLTRKSLAACDDCHQLMYLQVYQVCLCTFYCRRML